jgi:hypothetical protein
MAVALSTPTFDISMITRDSACYSYSGVQSLCFRLLWKDKCFLTRIQHLDLVILRQDGWLSKCVLFVCVPRRKMLYRNDLHLLSVGVLWFKLDRSHDNTRLCFTSETFLSGGIGRDEVEKRRDGSKHAPALLTWIMMTKFLWWEVGRSALCLECFCVCVF